MQNDQTTVTTNDNEFDLDDLLLSASQEADIRAGFDLTVAPQPPKPCLGCQWGPPMLNHNETPVRDEEEDPAPLHDLPVAQAELDMVQGGSASPQPVLLVIADQRDFYFSR